MLNNLPLAREDWAFVIIGLGVLLAVFLFNTGGSSSDVPAYCEDWAEATQHNLSLQYGDVSCKCISGETYEDRLDTPEKVRNVSELTFISCSVNDQKILFPIWRINNSQVLDNRTGNYSNYSGAQVIE